MRRQPLSSHVTVPGPSLIILLRHRGSGAAGLVRRLVGFFPATVKWKKKRMRRLKRKRRKMRQRSK